MKAAVYCRVSTEDQAQHGSSLEGQERAAVDKARELGHEVLPEHVFREAWTGASLDRPLLDEARALIRRRTIDALVCYSTDRLSRNPIHIAVVAEECEKHGVALVFVTEPLDNSPEGGLIRYVKGYSAQMERAKIADRTLRGKREKARQGRLSTGGTALFGYAPVKGEARRIIDQEQAVVARRIFHMFAAEGYTLYRAVRVLNEHGVPAPRGGKWNENSVLRLLTNPSYMGESYVFRYRAVEPGYHKRDQVPYEKTKHVLRDRSEWIETPDATPAIVSKETFEAAQAQLTANRRKSPRNKKHYYLLTGRLKCGICGHSIVGSARKRRNGTDQRRYRCVSNLKSNYYSRCGQPSITADPLEDAVWEAIATHLKSPEVILAEVNRLREADKPDAIDAEASALERRLETLDPEEHRYIGLYGKGTIDEATLGIHLLKVRRDRDRLIGRLAELAERRQAVLEAAARYDTLAASLDRITAAIDDADTESKRDALDMLGVEVTVLPDGTARIDGVVTSDMVPYHGEHS